MCNSNITVYTYSHIIGTAPTSSTIEKNVSNEALVLCLPGKNLDVSLLLNKQKKFRHRGGRDAALAAMQQLERDGLGELVLKKAKGSVKVNYDIFMEKCV